MPFSNIYMSKTSTKLTPSLLHKIADQLKNVPAELCMTPFDDYSTERVYLKLYIDQEYRNQKSFIPKLEELIGVSFGRIADQGPSIQSIGDRVFIEFGGPIHPGKIFHGIIPDKLFHDIISSAILRNSTSFDDFEFKLYYNALIEIRGSGLSDDELIRLYHTHKRYSLLPNSLVEAVVQIDFTFKRVLFKYYEDIHSIIFDENRLAFELLDWILQRSDFSLLNELMKGCHTIEDLVMKIL